MAFRLELEAARTACDESMRGFLAAVDGFEEYDLLGASRCHGWTRLDVVVHTIGGWQEMLGGLVSLVEGEPTVDAASYWPAFAGEIGSGDPITTLMAQRRRTAVYSRPSGALEHLHDVAGMLQRGVAGFADRPCTWQGHVFAPGDYLAIWAVENAVHHLDLLSDVPVPATALRMSRATIEALVQEALPTTWSDEDAVLIGTGRVPAPAGLGELAARLPALG